MQAREGLHEYLNNSLVNKLIESPIPESCKGVPCILGIDEAGRGPVLGPMVYGVAYYPQKNEEKLARMKFADSKQLTEVNREKLFEAIQTTGDGFQDLGYSIKIISPNMISNSMLRRKKYNLNALSHDTAIALIKSIEAKGIIIAQVFVDTVGPAIKYREKLMSFFSHKYSFTVAEKADSKYPIVSAASVCAKVMRDRIVKNWKYCELSSLHLDAFELGSGYPGDAGTKQFLEDSVDPVFGYSTLARFSWSTIPKMLDKKACKCDWNEPEDEDDDPKVVAKQQSFMKNYIKTKRPATSVSSKITKRETNGKVTNSEKYFEDRGLSRVIVWNAL